MGLISNDSITLSWSNNSKTLIALACCYLHGTFVGVCLVIGGTYRDILQRAGCVTNTHSCAILNLAPVSLVAAKTDFTWVMQLGTLSIMCLFNGSSTVAACNSQ